MRRQTVKTQRRILQYYTRRDDRRKTWKRKTKNELYKANKIKNAKVDLYKQLKDIKYTQRNNRKIILL